MAPGLAARMGVAEMTSRVSIIFRRGMTKGIPALLLWLLLLGGAWAFSAPAASAQINFAFSVGDGVDAYYLPTVSSFVYAYDGFYYDWAGNAWLYSTDYIGPWYPLPPNMVLPLPLEYGPPPPVVPYQPYFVWWRARVAPWYRINHPAWWLRHRVDLDHYRIWRMRVIPRYRVRPFFRGPMHPVFRPRFGVVVPGVRPLVRRPFVRRPVIHPVFRPVRPGFRPVPGPAPFVYRPRIRRYAGLPIRPLVRPAFRRPARPPVFRPARPVRLAPRPPMRRPILQTFARTGPGRK